MKHLKRFNESLNKQYGVIYIKVCPPKGSRMEWMKYCYIFSAAPKSLQQDIIQIADSINTKYSNDIIIPMDKMLHPGCVTTPDKVDEIANDMYNQFHQMMEKYMYLEGVSDSVRCVYSTGELVDINVKSTHALLGGENGYDKVMLKVGRFLDESDETGIFKI